MTRRCVLGTFVLGWLAPACSSETAEMWPAAPVHWSSSESEAPLPPSPVTPTQRERGLGDAYVSALASPGCADLGPILTEEAHFVFGARNTHGREQVVKSHEDMLGAFDQRRFFLNRVWLTDSTHVVNSQALEWTMTGVQAGEWMGLPPAHKPVVIKGLTLLWTSDEGIISDIHVYFDEGVVKAELGDGPPELKRLPMPLVDQTAAEQVEHTGTPAEAANAEILRASVQTLEDGKETEFSTLMADNVDIFTLDHAEPIRGKQGARAYYRIMRGSIRLLDTIIENVWGVQSFAIVEYGINGLQSAPLPRLPFAEGRALHTQFVDVAEIHDGKIAHIWRYSDPSEFASL